MPDDAIERARQAAMTVGTEIASDWIVALADGKGAANPLANRIADALLAFASQQAPEGWRPIADAPNDAREMLGWAEGCGFEVVRVDSSGKCYSGAFDADWVKFVRPLPAPPAMLDAAPSVTLGEVG